jgi:hypothetical protein
MAAEGFRFLQLPLKVPKPYTQSKKQQNREFGETAFPDQGLGRMKKKAL